MHDISSIIKLAYESRDEWTFERMEKAIRLLTQIPKVFVDWDTGAGEEWASFIYDNKVSIANLNANMPLIIYRAEYRDLIQNVLSGDDKLYTIEADNFEDRVYQMEPSTINMVFGNRWSDHVPSDQFSIHDFWWTTI